MRKIAGHEEDFLAVYAAVSILVELTPRARRPALLKLLRTPDGDMTASIQMPSVRRAAQCLSEAANRVLRIHRAAGEGDYGSAG